MGDTNLVRPHPDFARAFLARDIRSYPPQMESHPPPQPYRRRSVHVRNGAPKHQARRPCHHKLIQTVLTIRLRAHRRLVYHLPHRRVHNSLHLPDRFVTSVSFVFPIIPNRLLTVIPQVSNSSSTRPTASPKASPTSSSSHWGSASSSPPPSSPGYTNPTNAA